MKRQVEVGYCVFCHHPTLISVTDEQLKRLHEWKNTLVDRPLIQDTFPDLTDGQRESIISGIHETCFDDNLKDLV